ncbi:hypothetical protein FPL04_07520 [Xanthomonas arboricola]|nr:hypothetical protein FPL04_07520 [Xanthomonas arboricola]
MRTAEATPAGPDRRVTKGMAARSLRCHQAGTSGAGLVGTRPMTPCACRRRAGAACLRCGVFHPAAFRLLGGQRCLDRSA